MSRLTKWVDGKPLENHDLDATAEERKKGNKFRAGTREIMRRLAAYEDTNLEPEGIEALIEACAQLEAKNAALKAKVAEYEKAEQEGLIVRLPCKEGDTVYKICKICSSFKIGDLWDGKAIKTNCDRCPYGSIGCFGLQPDIDSNMVTELPNRRTDWIWIYRQDFGKTVFLTKEAAEAELARRKGNSV